MPTLQARKALSPSLADTLAAELTVVSADQLDELPSPQPHKGYARVTLHRDDHVEVAAARWLAGGQSDLHGHGDSAAVYVVRSGVVEEERYLPEGDSYRCETVVLRAGDRTFLPPGSFHCVRALEEAVTLHSYSPPPDDATAAVPPQMLRRLDLARRRSASEQSGRRLRELPCVPA